MGTRTAFLYCLLAACTTERSPKTGERDPAVMPATPSDAAPPPSAGAEQDHAEPAGAKQAPPSGEGAAAETVLTAEERTLIEADPVTLSPELRRKRAYALRKKIMQKPDSEAAQTLESLREAAARGELGPPPADTPTLGVPGPSDENAGGSPTPGPPAPP